MAAKVNGVRVEMAMRMAMAMARLERLTIDLWWDTGDAVTQVGSSSKLFVVTPVIKCLLYHVFAILWAVL